METSNDIIKNELIELIKQARQRGYIETVALRPKYKKLGLENDPDVLDAMELALENVQEIISEKKESKEDTLNRFKNEDGSLKKPSQFNEQPVKGENEVNGYMARPNTTQIPNLMPDYFIPGFSDIDELKTYIYIGRRYFGYPEKRIPQGMPIPQTDIMYGWFKEEDKGKQLDENRIDFGAGIKTTGDERRDRVYCSRITTALQDKGYIHIKKVKLSAKSKHKTNVYSFPFDEQLTLKQLMSLK